MAVLTFLFTPASNKAPEPVAEVQPAPSTPAAQNLLAGLPSRFEPNLGQAGDGVAYTLKAKGYTASLSPGAIYFALAEGKGSLSPEDRLKEPARQTEPARRSVVSMAFVGANPSPEIEALDPQEGTSNYFLGNDPSKWTTNVPGYSKIYYRDLYEGIDMVIFDDHGQVRYDFIVAPGADPAQIEIAFEGSQSLKISDAGDLVVSSPYGDLTHRAPFSYQGETEIESSFEIRGGRAGFSLGAYDHTRVLTIDPSLAYSSYLGGSSDEFGYSGYYGRGIAVDSSGAAYVAASTASANFPTASAIQATNAGWSDVFVAKLNATGSGLAYSTYLGGAGIDDSYGIAVDSSGAAYVTGWCGSDFPLLSPIQGARAGGFDAFVTKISAAGSALSYSTYLGGGANDVGYAIAIDLSGAAYITGHTYSFDFPLSTPIQSAYGGDNAFVTKVNAEGTALSYSTYLGGTGGSRGLGIAVDSSGAAYVTGDTYTSNFPMASPFQSANAGWLDAFVTKINAAGSALSYSTYLGGSSDDSGRGIAVDSSGAAYVTGMTISTFFPTASPFQASRAGNSDAFVTKVAPNGGSLFYSSYLGGNAFDSGGAIGVDSSGAAYVSGSTWSTDFPMASPIQGSIAGSYDAFVTRINTAGSALSYSTYVGGTGTDYGYAIAVDSSGAAYVSGISWSTDFPTVSPFQGSNAGGADTFVAKIAPTLSGTITNSNGSRVSVYRTSDGTQVATGFTSPTGDWSLVVPESINCPTSGYKIYAEAPAGYQPRWYDLKENYSSADCIDAPSSGLDMTLPPSVVVEGTITDEATGLPIDGAVIYAFRANGQFSNWTRSGKTSPGHYKFELTSGETYKILVVHGNMNRWFGGADNFTEASSCLAPCTANLSVPVSVVITGYVKDAATADDIDGASIYLWNASTGAFAGWTYSGISGPGRYSVNVLPGPGYKVLAHPDIAHEDLWSDGAPGYIEASPVIAPQTANFSLREAALITGTATASGGGPMPNGLVAAYTTCGCSTPQVAITGSDGSYNVKVASTTASGWQYRVRFISPSYETSWYSDSTSFGGSTPVSAPSGGINQQTPA